MVTQRLTAVAIYIQSLKKILLSSVQEALTMAKQTNEDLGMAKLLQLKGSWDYPPIPGSRLDVRKEDDPDDSEDMEEFSFLQQETDLERTAEDVKTEIAQLSDAKIIEDKLKDQMDAVHKKCFKSQ